MAMHSSVLCCCGTGHASCHFTISRRVQMLHKSFTWALGTLSHPFHVSQNCQYTITTCIICNRHISGNCTTSPASCYIGINVNHIMSRLCCTRNNGVQYDMYSRLTTDTILHVATRLDGRVATLKQQLHNSIPICRDNLFISSTCHITSRHSCCLLLNTSLQPQSCPSAAILLLLSRCHPRPVRSWNQYCP